MRKILLIPLLATCLVGTAQAGLATFDFESVAGGTDAAAISTYMSNTYGSLVTVSANTAVTMNTGPASYGLPPWSTNSTSYIWSDPAPTTSNRTNIEITFETPIYGIAFQGFVFEASGGADFTFTAFGSKDGTQVYRQTWNDGVGEISPTWISFDQPVSFLHFSDNGEHAVGVDNLVVQAVPLPTSVLLGVFAVGLVGRKLRKFV